MDNLKVEGSLIFFYYKDLVKASDFYTNIMGFKIIMDKEYEQVYKLRDGAYFGIIDEKHGLKKTSPQKPVILGFIVSDADTWFNHFKKLGVKANRDKPKEMGNNPGELKMKVFHIWDPGGYTIEIQEFLTPRLGQE